MSLLSLAQYVALAQLITGFLSMALCCCCQLCVTRGGGELRSLLCLSPGPELSVCSSFTYTSGEGKGTPLQYSCLENPMNGGAWLAAVHGVAKSQTRLSDFTFTFHLHAPEKEMATHSSVLAWRIPGTGEPGGLLSMGLHRIGHD